MSRFQREKGTDSLLFVFVDEDSEQDAVHRGAVLESAQGSSPDLPALDSVGGSDLPALIGVLETGQQIVEIVAQACDGPGVCIFPAFGEAPGGAPGLSVVGAAAWRSCLTVSCCEPCRGHILCARQRWTGMPWYAVGRAASKPWPPSTQIISRPSPVRPRRRDRRGSAPIRRRSRPSPGGSDDLLPAVGTQAEDYQHRALEGAGAGLAAEHHAVEHQGLVAVGQWTAMESLDCCIQGLGDPADGCRRNRAAEQRQQGLANLAGGQPQHKAGQDRAVDLRSAPGVAPDHGDRAVTAGARHLQLDSSLSRLRRQAPLRRSRAAAPSRLPSHRSTSSAIRPSPPGPARAVALAPVQPVGRLHDLEGLPLDRRSLRGAPFRGCCLTRSSLGVTKFN